MTLNLGLEDVPFAILEAVKARILASRIKAQQDKDQNQQKRSTEPRPQFAKLGARPNVYRLPRAYALSSGGQNVGHVWLQSKYTQRTDTGLEGLSAYQSIGTGIAPINTVVNTTANTGKAWDYDLICGVGSSRVSYSFGMPALSLLPKGSLPAPVTYPSNELPGTPPYSITVNVARQYNENTDYIGLPVGGGAFILVMMHSFDYYVLNLAVKHYGTYSADGLLRLYPNADIRDGQYQPGGVSFTSDGQTLNKAFLCSNQGVKQIAIPATLKTLIETMYNPLYTTASQVIYPGWWYFYNRYGLTEPVPVGNPVSRPNIDLVTGMGTVSQSFDPSIFAFLNASNYPFVDASQIKTFPDTSRWLVSDTSFGAYTLAGQSLSYNQWYAQGLSMGYGLWNTPGEEPYYQDNGTGIYDPIYDPAMYEPDDNATMTVGSNPQQLKDGADLTLLVAWDWDDPGYCYAMCKALGFSDADLTP